MKSIIRKFKKLKSIYKILYIVLSIILLISICFLTYELLKLKKIETVLRIIFIIVCFICFFISLFINILFLFSKKNKLFIANSILGFIISVLFIFVSVNIHKTYGIVNNIEKDKITYSTSLVVLKDTEFKDTSDFKVAMIKDESNVDNIIANELMETKKIKNIDVKYYDDYLEMLADLYSKKINGIFISSGYVDVYSVYENYQNIESDTKVVYSYKKEMKNIDNELSTNKSLTEPFTILLLGVDSAIDGLNANTAFNGDTMMLITFNPKTLNTTVFSIPRDTYVPIACNGNRQNKINSSAAYGTSCVINTIKNLIGIDIDYYVKINFKGVVDLVDSLGGIELDVPIKFCEQNSNREFGDNLICLDKGYQTLNGEQALALSRHRKTLLLGDFERVQNQQLVVEAIAKKAKNIRSKKKFDDVLNSITKNIDTNIKTEEILNLYNVAKKIFTSSGTLNIEKTYLTGYDLTLYIPGLGNVYTFQYYEQSLKEIVDAMKINLEITKPKLTKTFTFSVNKPYEKDIIGKKYYTVERNEALPNFIGSNINYLKEWASSRNITIVENYITKGMEGYDETKDGIIINQSVVKGTLVSSINTLSVDVIKVEKETDNSSNNNENVDNNIDTDIKDNTEDNNQNSDTDTLDNKDTDTDKDSGNEENKDSENNDNENNESEFPPTNLPTE